jgi:hypothetical protein
MRSTQRAIAPAEMSSNMRLHIHPSAPTARRAALAVAFLVAMSAAVMVPASLASTVTLSQRSGAGAQLISDDRTGRTLAVWFRGSEGSQGDTGADVVARLVGRTGRPIGGETSIGTGAITDLAYNGGSQLAVALDTRRHHFLVAWSAHKPGMARVPCPPHPHPPGFPVMACSILDREVFVRLLDRRGRPIGPERRVTTTGPDDRADTSAVVPSAAYDRRHDTFLLAYAGTTASLESTGALHARRLRPDGRPRGGARRLALRPSPESVAPLVRVIDRPRGGYLLAFTWGPDFNERHLYLRPLTSTARPTGSTTRLTRAGGPGAGGVQLVSDTRGRRALVLWFGARAGARSGLRARAVRLNGRPAAGAVALPYRLGSGPVAAAAAARGRGWLYTVSQERRDGPHRLVAQRATSAGRPSGAIRTIAPAEDDALEGTAVRSGRRFLIAWTAYPFGHAGASHVRSRLISG